MNNEYSTKVVEIKCETEVNDISPKQNKCFTESVQIQDIKIDNASDIDEHLYINQNITNHSVEVKEENSNFDFKNSLNTDHKNVETIKFLYIKVEQKDDLDTTERSLDNNIDPFATKNSSFICDYCQRAFTTAEYCKKHAGRCRNRVFNQPFTSSDNISVDAVLERKPKLVIDQENLYQCQQCDYNCKSQSGLYLHTRTHSGVGLHTCIECGKQFTTLSDLARHMLIHTKEKHHKCTQCNAAFSQAGNLKAHMLTHNGVKAHKCTQCGKSFTQSSHLTTHMRTHTAEKPYKCTQCEKSFTRSDTLTKHMRTHRDKKSYKCIQCDKPFTRSDFLIAHMSTHTGEMPYQCTICNKAYSKNSHLKKHIKSHTNEAGNKP